MTTRQLVLLILAAALTAVFVVSCSEQPPVTGTTLHRGLPTDPESLDPHKARTIQAADVLRDIGEGLVGYSPTGELVPAAAQRWEQSEDGTSYTFYLQPDARWSNGEPVVAEHFVFALRRLVDPGTAAFYAQFLADIENAAAIVAGDKAPSELGVEALDELTLRVQLVRPTPYLLSLLTHPSTFPVHPGSVAAHGDRFARPGNLLSNGAYVLDSWVPGSIVALRRNEHYRNNAGTAIDNVLYHVIIQTNAELNRFRASCTSRATCRPMHSRLCANNSRRSLRFRRSSGFTTTATT